jgi:hypothetical protein
VIYLNVGAGFASQNYIQMKKLIIGMFALSGAYAQVIEQDINCHQGLIDLTMVDTSNTPGTYHLYYFDNDWVLLQGAYIEFQPDTFYMTFSGIGEEMHDYQFMKLEFTGSDVTQLTMPCIGVGIEESVDPGELVSIEYYSLTGQLLTNPLGLCIELKTYRNKQTWRKIYRN